MQEIDRVKEELLREIWEHPTHSPQNCQILIDRILSIKIDGTTLKELIEKLDETGGKLAIVDDDEFMTKRVIWQGGQG